MSVRGGGVSCVDVGAMRRGRREAERRMGVDSTQTAEDSLLLEGSRMIYVEVDVAPNLL